MVQRSAIQLFVERVQIVQSHCPGDVLLFLGEVRDEAQCQIVVKMASPLNTVIYIV